MQDFGSDLDPRVHKDTVTAFTHVRPDCLSGVSLLALPPSQTAARPPVRGALEGFGAGAGGAVGKHRGVAPVQCSIVRVKAQKQEYLKYFKSTSIS